MSSPVVCPLCQRQLAETCPERPCLEGLETYCPLTTGICGHHFHFHCISTYLKHKGVCPVDDTLWEFSRYWLRSALASPEVDKQDHQVCHESHPELYRTINAYRMIRCAGRYDPVSYGLLCDIYDHLMRAGHPYTKAFKKCIQRLPEGGMMISFDDWEWHFRFLDKLAVSPIDVKNIASVGFEEPPSWMRGQKGSRQEAPVTAIHQTVETLDRVLKECRLLAESDAFMIEWDEETRQLFAERRRGRDLRGDLHIFGQVYPIHVSLPSDWPFKPPVVNFPASQPSVNLAFRIDSAGNLHTDQGDWCPALSVEKWLLMILVDVLKPPEQFV